ncbi:MAG TPA: bifunctional glutamate N-acetyltransferase/amino-acid acetyltransferase ArgJ [Candidatus Udaeobacter sp.]|nr:bifunctional glutamate N-acetyltransferase/amino-acid acetyltransferase ArgJ [Candidatus Udaeobacter sp.]
MSDAGHPGVAAVPLLPTDEQLAAFRLAAGFECAAAACGLKKGGALDLALIHSARPCAAAGVFTTNRFQAAPVRFDREVLATSAGRVRGIVANAGCANAVTGERGDLDARYMAARAAERIGAEPGQVLVLSTGVIGVFLDRAKLDRGFAALGSDAASRAPADVARAITTTDTRPKIAAAEARIAGGTIRVAGFAKGAGMIHPRMATMLAVLTTDATCEPSRLDRVLRAGVERSFNRISVDGDMSTNDTVLALASGASGLAVDDSSEPAFEQAMEAVCASLARQIARDGEGATRLIELAVTGAESEPQAHRVGDAIACSPLVKTAIHGRDPNWGRILAAAGYSGAAIDAARVALWFGDGDAVQLVERGLPLAFDRARASTLLGTDPVNIRIDLGLGSHGTTLWTCDLSAEYVRINADYTT